MKQFVAGDKWTVDAHTGSKELVHGDEQSYSVHNVHTSHIDIPPQLSTSTKLYLVH